MSHRNSPEFVRLFIALPVPAVVKQALRELQQQLRRIAPGDGVRWLGAEQFHLTLKFLGSVTGNHLETVIAATREAAGGGGSILLRAEGLGFFPHARSPRVIWVGFGGDTLELRKLQSRIESRVGEFAERKEDREFSAHLTLARVKCISPAESRALAEFARGMTGRVLGEWRSNVVQVMQSELQPQGSRYSCLAEIPLTVEP